jgi:hypothetical protein
LILINGKHRTSVAIDADRYREPIDLLTRARRLIEMKTPADRPATYFTVLFNLGWLYLAPFFGRLCFHSTGFTLTLPGTKHPYSQEHVVKLREHFYFLRPLRGSFITHISTIRWPSVTPVALICLITSWSGNITGFFWATRTRTQLTQFRRSSFFIQRIVFAHKRCCTAIGTSFLCAVGHASRQVRSCKKRFDHGSFGPGPG